MVFVLFAVLVVIMHPVVVGEHFSDGRQRNLNGTEVIALDMRSRQYEALRSFHLATRMSTTGDNCPLAPPMWVFDDDGGGAMMGSYCNFTGIKCDSGEVYVTGLSLPHSCLSGTLPDIFADLPRLVSLHLYNNSLYGTIPESLHHATTLRHIQLGFNFISGTFPDLSELKFLTRLSLGRNAISGTIPLSLCNVSKLELLDISYVTKMWGRIPDCLGRLDMLSTFRITDVGLTGTVPTELCSIRKMNGFSPNLYGCDAVACPAEYYQRTAGRRIGDHGVCLPCTVPSNVLATTTCQWHETFDRTSMPSTSPTGAYHPTSTKPSVVPSVPPSTDPSSPPFKRTDMPTTVDSSSPSVSSAAPTPPISAQPSASVSPTAAPTSIPTLSFHPMPGPSTNPSDTTTIGPVISSKAPTRRVPILPTRTLTPSVQFASRERVVSKAGLATSATLVTAGAVILMLLLIRKRRSSEPAHVRFSDDTSQELEPDLPKQNDSVLALPEEPEFEVELGSVLFQSADVEPTFIVRATTDGALAPVQRPVPSILKTSLASDQKGPRRIGALPIMEEATRKVRFASPEPLAARGTSADKTSTERVGTVSHSVSMKDAAQQHEREAWLTWLLNPLTDPINRCTAPFRGTASPDPDSAISIDSNYSTLSAMLKAANEENSLDEIDFDDKSPPQRPPRNVTLGIQARSRLDNKLEVTSGKKQSNNVDEIFRLRTSHDGITTIEVVKGSYDDTEYGEV